MGLLFLRQGSYHQAVLRLSEGKVPRRARNHTREESRIQFRRNFMGSSESCFLRPGMGFPQFASVIERDLNGRQKVTEKGEISSGA